MIYKLLSYKAQPYIFALLFSFYYLVTPLMAYYAFQSDPYQLQLATLSFISLLFLLLGYFALDKLLVVPPLKLWTIKKDTFIWFVFACFVVFLIATMVTATSIPLIHAMHTRDPYELAVVRANFLKARDGYERIFVYLNAILTTSFVPYMILLSFVSNFRYKWFMLLTPYLYSFVLLEKAFFLKFILPFISLNSYLSKEIKYKKFVWIGLISIPLVIYINTAISGFGGNTEKINLKASCSNFYAPAYALCASNGRLNFIAWRIIAVPVFTAIDSLKVFDAQYNHELLLGKTSSALSLMTHQNNIKFEREVFKFEWGTEETGTASANSVFIIEQFINFGWIGVILSSLIVGFIFRVFNQSKDVAFASLAIVFSISILFGGFISTMLSAGYLFLFVFLFFTRLE